MTRKHSTSIQEARPLEDADMGAAARRPTWEHLVDELLDWRHGMLREHVPATEMQAIMETAPGQVVQRSREEMEYETTPALDALDQLPELHRIVIYWVLFEKRSLRQIGRDLEAFDGRVRPHPEQIARIRDQGYAMLRLQLQEENDDDETVDTEDVG